MNNVAVIRSCKSAENVLNEVNMSEKKKKSGACNKQLMEEAKWKEVVYSNTVSFHNFRLFIFHSAAVSCHVISSKSSHRFCIQA